MKVSDAMRLADEMGLPDLRRKFIESNVATWKYERPPCCAIGGASVASRSFRMEVNPGGFLTNDSWLSAQDVPRCDDRVEFARTRWVECPCGEGKQLPHLYSASVHLYDEHEWSRTQIADWLDSLDSGVQA